MDDMSAKCHCGFNEFCNELSQIHLKQADWHCSQDSATSAFIPYPKNWTVGHFSYSLQI